MEDFKLELVSEVRYTLIRGVKSVGGHFACLCRGFDFYEVKKKKKSCIFQKENGNTLTLLIIILVKSIQKEQIAQITQYDPRSAGINPK